MKRLKKKQKKEPEVCQVNSDETLAFDKIWSYFCTLSRTSIHCNLKRAGCFSRRFLVNILAWLSSALYSFEFGTKFLET